MAFYKQHFGSMIKQFFQFIRTEWRSALSITAVVSGLSALYVSSQQLRIASEEQQASVFPYLVMAYNNSAEHLELFVTNEGTGPAFISGVEVKLRDSVYSDFWTPVQYFLDTLQSELVPVTSKSDLLPGWVIRAGGEQYKLFRLDNLNKDSSIKFWQYFTDRKNGARIKIWYLDLYNNCWLFDQKENTVTRCAKCPRDVLHR